MLAPSGTLDAALAASLSRLGADRTAQAGDVRLPAQRFVTLGHDLSQDVGMCFVVHDMCFLCWCWCCW